MMKKPQITQSGRRPYWGAGASRAKILAKKTRSLLTVSQIIQIFL